MKILLINNNTVHLDNLSKALRGHQVEMQVYKPGLDFHWRDKDLVLLSGGGGEGLEIHDVYQKGKLWYDDQMKFVKGTRLPIIGICMGFEVITRAYGSDVKELPELVQGFKYLDTTKAGSTSLLKSKLKQFEAHNWSVREVNTADFDVLASSETGIEMIKHKKRDLIATQFHPEKGGTLTLPSLLKQFAL